MVWGGVQVLGWLSSPDVPEGCPGGHSARGRVAGVPTRADRWLVSPQVTKQTGLKWLAWGELEGDFWSVWSLYHV